MNRKEEDGGKNLTTETATPAVGVVLPGEGSGEYLLWHFSV